MKKISLAYLTILNSFILLILGLINYGCSEEFGGNGIDSIIWNGSTLPEDSMFINPIFEPDFTCPSLIRGTGAFYAYGNENQWSTGLNFQVPIIVSKNLVNWTLYGSAFSAKPSWVSGKITSVSVYYSSSYNLFLMFYNSSDDESIGLAYSESALGPFTDYGKVLDKDSVNQISTADPFFIQIQYKIKVGVRWVLVSKDLLFFGKDKGIYGIELKINVTANNKIASVQKVGIPFRIAGEGIRKVYISKLNNRYYLFGNIGEPDSSKVVLGIGDSIQGPYFDKNGNTLIESHGTIIISSSKTNRFQSPGNVGGIVLDKNNNYWILYNAIDVQRKLLPSGEKRQYPILNRIEFGEDGWPINELDVITGWTYPRIAL